MSFYIVVSRDNVRSNVLEKFPPIMDENFKEFNNEILSSKFHNETEIMLWLENSNKRDSIQDNSRYNKSIRRNILPYEEVMSLKNLRLDKLDRSNNNRSKNINTHIDKIYGVYSFDKETKKVKYLYSLRKKLPHESHTIIRENNKKIFGTYKRVCENTLGEFMLDSFEYSSDPIKISGQQYEGIYPLNLEIKHNNKDIISEFIDFVKDIYKNENTKIDSRDISIIDDTESRKLQLSLISKLKAIEKLLIDITSRNDTLFEPKNNTQRNDLISYTIHLLRKHNDDIKLSDDILSLIMDPVLFNGEIFQIRFENELITWHKNYSDILLKYSIMPSKYFTKLILDFDISDLTKLFQSYDNILKIAMNLEKYFDLNVENENQRKIVTIPRRKFKKLQAKFN